MAHESFGSYIEAKDLKPGSKAEDDEDTSAQRFEGFDSFLLSSVVNLETFKSSQIFRILTLLIFQLTCDAKSYLGMI